MKKDRIEFTMEEKIENIISNTLTNIYDWDSEDIKSDFVHFLNSEYKVDVSLLELVFDRYDALPALDKDSVEFDINNFVKKLLN